MKQNEEKTRLLSGCESIGLDSFSYRIFLDEPSPQILPLPQSIIKLVISFFNQKEDEDLQTIYKLVMSSKDIAGKIFSEKDSTDDTSLADLARLHLINRWVEEQLKVIDNQLKEDSWLVENVKSKAECKRKTIGATIASLISLTGVGGVGYFLYDRVREYIKYDRLSSQIASALRSNCNTRASNDCDRFICGPVGNCPSDMCSELAKTCSQYRLMGLEILGVVFLVAIAIAFSVWFYMMALCDSHCGGLLIDYFREKEWSATLLNQRCFDFVHKNICEIITDVLGKDPKEMHNYTIGDVLSHLNKKYRAAQKAYHQAHPDNNFTEEMFARLGDINSESYQYGHNGFFTKGRKQEVKIELLPDNPKKSS